MIYIYICIYDIWYIIYYIWYTMVNHGKPMYILRINPDWRWCYRWLCILPNDCEPPETLTRESHLWDNPFPTRACKLQIWTKVAGSWYQVPRVWKICSICQYAINQKTDIASQRTIYIMTVYYIIVYLQYFTVLYNKKTNTSWIFAAFWQLKGLLAAARLGRVACPQ